MKITARISLFLTILIFIVLCINVLYFCLSLCLWGLAIDTKVFHPVVGALIPIVLLINMISLLYTCDYKDNLILFHKLIASDKIKLAIYASMGLINPMLLYMHTRSFINPIRILGILKCFPIFNFFIYLRLIEKLRQKGYSRNNIVTLYFKGLLIINIIREDEL